MTDHDIEETDIAEETSPVEDLVRELNDLRRAGNELAGAAHRVSAEYDGVHRLRLALSGWYMALANEWGRAGREVDG